MAEPAPSQEGRSGRSTSWSACSNQTAHYRRRPPRPYDCGGRHERCPSIHASMSARRHCSGDSRTAGGSCPRRCRSSMPWLVTPSTWASSCSSTRSSVTASGGSRAAFGYSVGMSDRSDMWWGDARRSLDAEDDQGAGYHRRHDPSTGNHGAGGDRGSANCSEARAAGAARRFVGATRDTAPTSTGTATASGASNR